MPRKKSIQPSMRWFWFSVVIAGLPIVFMALFYITFGHIDGYDIKDVLFGCLGLSLGNFNLIIYQHDKKFALYWEKIIVESAILACGSCLLLGIVFAAECVGNGGVGFLIYLLMYVLVICSLFLGYSANRTALKLLSKI